MLSRVEGVEESPGLEVGFSELFMAVLLVIEIVGIVNECPEH